MSGKARIFDSSLRFAASDKGGQSRTNDTPGCCELAVKGLGSRTAIAVPRLSQRTSASASR
jgi:hypothetical protein